MASVPRGRTKTNPPQLKAHAQQEVRAGRLHRAIELLEEVLRQVPDDWPSLQRLADLRARSGDRRGAVDLYRRLAEHYEEDDHVARAIATWRLVLRHDPAFLGTHLKLGALYARHGFRVESRIHYETAIAGFQRAGRPHEAAEARRALDAVEGRTATAPETSQAVPGTCRESPHVAAGTETQTATGTARPFAVDAVDPPSVDEEEFVAERLVEAKMFRRYNLLAQARRALEAVLQRAPDHIEAREELVEVLRDQGETERAAEEQRHLRRQGAPPTAVPAPERADITEPGSVADVDLGDLEVEVVDEQSGRPVATNSAEADTLTLANLFDEDLVFNDGPIAAGTLREPAPPEPGVARGRPHRAASASNAPPILRHHVDTQIGSEDYGARYDLGIAYREMGLMDEAIAEFQLAAREPDRLVDCASLMAGCFVEKGLPGLAVQWLERGLAAPNIGEEERQALRYELGDALELSGETERALDVFTELYGEAAGYRDVADRVRRLRAVVSAREGT